jgi:hypothetical protein
MSTVALVGAGGKMGCRITDNMKKQSAYRMLHVEVAPAGIANLEKRGVAAVATAEAVPQADFVVLAVPDNRVEAISAQVVPLMRPGACLVHLDPAAPCAGRVFRRDDVAYFVTHPCHPPVFNDETDLEAKRDYFGGIKARQAIVCALLRGDEANFALAEDVAKRMYAPVIRSHRASVDQMAILEPVLSETVTATCLTIIREATDEAVRRGVPAQAAFDFVLGHINVELAILFDQLPGVRMSDAANRAVERAKREIFAPDWKKVFERDAITESIHAITRGH